MNSSEKGSSNNSLLDILAVRARETSAGQAFELDERPYTCRWLWKAINGFAGALVQAGISPAERVLISLPNSPDFFSAFYGVQRAGGIPVPVHPDSGIKRLERIADLCAARRVVVPRGDPVPKTGLHTLNAGLRGAAGGPFAEIQPDDTAYIQFTSGSTGEPKGVPIRHIEVLTNIRQMIAGMEITSSDVFVSWLPVHHDMGLVLMTMVPFYAAARLIVLESSFISLRSWLSKLASSGGTFTAAPDFGYRLALRYTTRPGELDLSSLRVALNAAESVRPDTVRKFERAFGLTNVMTAGYGLAEATVGVSMTAPGAGVQVDSNGIASVGHPFPGVEVRILREDGKPAGPGEGGEILVHSPASTRGYFQDPDANRDLFWGEKYLRTGDIGYLSDSGELFILGRKKEMLKHAGRTVAPREVEMAVDGHPDLRSAAAVSTDLGGPAGEQIILFCALRRPGGREEGGLHALSVDLVAQVQEYMGFRPARVYLVKPGAIPRTPNGKVQRLLLRDQFVRGELRARGLILYPDF